MAKAGAAGDGPFSGDIERVVVSRGRIARRVGELAGQIAEGYRGRELTVLAVLTGSLMFLCDLLRDLPLRVHLEAMWASSYPGKAIKSAGPKLRMPAGAGLTGRDVLVVDDIVDTGRTLKAVVDRVSSHRPRSVKTCVLLAKCPPAGEAGRAGERLAIAPDFCGFAIPPEFVVGYGLDFGGLYRNLPDVCTLKECVLAAAGGGGGPR